MDEQPPNGVAAGNAVLTPHERLAMLKRRHGVDYSVLQEPAQLPSYVKMAIMFKVLYGMTWKKAASEVKRGVHGIVMYAKSPAGKKFADRIAEVASDEGALAQMFWKASASDLSVAAMTNLQLAIEAGDYREVGVQLRDMMDRAGIEKSAKHRGEGATVIQINLGERLLAEVPAGTSSHERVIDAEIVEDDENEEL
jgi:hypothetical protein